MVAHKIFSGLNPVVSGLAVFAAFVAAQPALANSSNAADIAAPLRAAQEARKSVLGNTDAEFRQHFASWRSLDRTGAIGTGTANPVRRAGIAVSIPSRMPVEGVRLTSSFGMRYHPVLGGRRNHAGVDLAAPMGSPIYATADGAVSTAEWTGGYGLLVSLDHGGELQTRYGHMSRLNVAAGQQVRKGDLIGFVGSTGRSTGPHLHYEVRIAGTAVNPIPYMQADEVQQPVTTVAAVSSENR